MPEAAEYALIVALAEAQVRLAAVQQELADCKHALQCFADEIAPVLFAHLKGDGSGVYDAIVAFVDKRCEVMQIPGNGMLQ